GASVVSTIIGGSVVIMGSGRMAVVMGSVSVGRSVPLQEAKDKQTATTAIIKIYFLTFHLSVKQITFYFIITP
ncbi:MAG: hypothetical protein IIV03_01180, partial [Clostridia bacterium]|nr:hypothetical protein [Clostridia bacterium]